MSKALLVCDDGLTQEIKWDFSRLKYDVTKLSFLEDQSGKGTILEVTPRSFIAKEVSPNWYVTDLFPVNAVEWAQKTLGPFDLVVIGPNRGLNLGDKSYFSSSSMAMGKIMSHYGVRSIVISMDTKKGKFSGLGGRRLCSMINKFSQVIEPSYILSLNFICGDPAQARQFAIRTLPDESNILFHPSYNKDLTGEWQYSIKGSKVQGYKSGTVIFTLIPRY